MKKLLSAVLVAFLVCSGIQAKVIYVSPSGNDANSGESWAQAVKEPQVAMNKAVAGDEIWLQGGTYTLTASYIPGTTSGSEAGLWVAEGVNIYGGFAGTETAVSERALTSASPWDFTNLTVFVGAKKMDGTTPLRLIDRAYKNDVFTVETVIDGITFRDIDAVSSRIVFLKASHVVRNCAFINCKDNQSVLYFEDGGMVENTLFEGCKNALYLRSTANPLTGGSAEHQTMQALNCVFQQNIFFPLSIYSTGEPIDATPTVVVKGCKFIGNDIPVTNPYDPSKYYSAGIGLNHTQQRRPAIVSECLFEGNTYRDNGASAVFITGSGLINVFNNIVRNNVTAKAEGITGESGVFVIYNPPTDGGGVFNNLIVNNTSNSTLLYGNNPIFFNNTIANNVGSIYFPLGSAIFNNIFDTNTIDGTDSPVKMDGADAVYLFNANSVAVDATPEALIMGDVLITPQVGFVAPTSFVGTGNAAAANYSLNSTSQAKGIGNMVETLGVDGLDYPAEWFTTYFSKDLGGNDRMTGSVIDAGAYQGESSSYLSKPVKSEQFCSVYVSDNQVHISSKESGFATVYNMTGSVVAQQEINAGLNRLTLNNQGIHIVKVTGVNKENFAKISLK